MRNARPERHPESVEPYQAGIAYGWIRRAFAAIFVLWFSLSPSQIFFLQGQTAEYPAKLAFLYNFTKFIEWPPESYELPGAPFVMCIIGPDPFGVDMENEVRARMVSGHPIHIRTVKS